MKRVSEKGLLYYVNPWKRKIVSHFKLWRPAIFEPFDQGYSNIRLLKALSTFYWNLKWKWEYLRFERPQTKFSEGGVFLVNWAVAPPGWCHNQFLYKFWKLCVRAFKWYIICGIFSTGRFFKWAILLVIQPSVRESKSPTVYDKCTILVITSTNNVTNSIENIFFSWIYLGTKLFIRFDVWPEIRILNNSSL